MKYWSNHPGNKLNKQTYDPHEEETKILEFWTKEKTTEKIQENRHQNNDEIYTILNGPTFPTGSPHSGHILNALIKDIFTRYAHQKNLKVESEFGWDCHGLPVEHEVDKKLEIKQPQDLNRLGVSKYNEECRKFIQRHQSDWKTNLDRIGIEMVGGGGYSTMNQEYMESVWAVFKQLFDLGLVYKGTKVLPHSTGCFTHLSHFEAQHNLKDRNQVAAIVALPIVESGVRLLIWTDSPWQLTANFAVCVNPSSKYVKVKLIANGQIYIVARNRLVSIFPNSNDFTLLEEIQGNHILHLKYHPLFEYLDGSYTILTDDSICDESGTGLIALCPHFNQNEYRICLDNGLSPDEALCPIDSCGRFTRSIAAGLTIEEANLFVVQNLQQRGLLVHVENVERQKISHCWRSDVPLIDKIASTWFLKINENIRENLKANNSQTTWVPAFYKQTMDNQFDKLSDWPIGRDRHWGNPIPIWSSPSGDEIRCISSIKELLELTNMKEGISDMHKEFLDKLLIPSSVPGNPPLRRVSEVFDCWFESGLLPILQQQKENNQHQVDLIVEGQDQINGWFLTTSILSGALSLPAPSKTILVHGLVQDSDGMKLSKRKHNHNDAIKIAEKYGADALRLYLVTSTLVAGESFALQEIEARKFNEKIFQPLYKIVYDIMPYFGKEGWVAYGIVIDTTNFTNIFEKWILSRAESLVQFYDSELKANRLHLVIPRLIEFLEQFHKWFIPAMRITTKDPNGNESIVFNVIYKTCLVLAPFAPFFTEYIFQIIKPWTIRWTKDFVHNLPLTEKSDQLIEIQLDLKIYRWQRIVEMVWEARTKHVIPIGYRIIELIVVHPLENYLDDNTEMIDKTLMKLGNVHQVIRTTDRAQFGISLKAELKLDSSLRQILSQEELEKISEAIENLSDIEVGELIRVGSQDILGQCVSLGDDVKISYVFENYSPDEKTTITLCRDDVFVVIKMNKNLGYYEEGTRIEIVSAVQKFRKKAKVYSSEFVTICYLTEDTCMESAFEKFSKELRKTTHSKVIAIADFCDSNEEQIYQETVSIKDAPVIFYLFKERNEEEQ